MIRICVQGSCSRAARTDSALCTDHDARPPQAPGVKHDAEKERWDLLPLDAATEVVRVLTVGAAKYAPDNWRKVPEARRRYLAAAWRHIVAWARGETLSLIHI